MDKGKKINVTSGVPALSIDGNGVGINKENGNANLLFIQISPNQTKDKKDLDATVVANVRMNFEQLKQLYESIGEAIEEYKPKKDV